MAALTPAEIADLQTREHESLQPSIIAVTVMAFTLPTIAVALRIYCRYLMSVPLGADDYLIIMACIACIGMQIAGCFAIAAGSGLHVIFADISTYSKASIATILAYALAICLTKSSLLTFYYRIFPIHALRIICLIVGSIVTFYAIAHVVLALTWCRPLRKVWEPAVEGTCHDPMPGFYALAIVNVITDGLILLIPIKCVWDLQQKPGKKFSVLGVFLLGSVVCVFGAIRVPAVKNSGHSADSTWNLAEGVIWSQAELLISIVCACLPTLMPLFRSESWLRSRRVSGYNRSQAYGRMTPNKAKQGSGGGITVTRDWDCESAREEDVLPLGNKTDVRMEALKHDRVTSRWSTWTSKTDAR